MKSLCGADCAACQWNSTCPGCDHEKCFIARYIQKDGKDAYEEAPRHEKPELILRQKLSSRMHPSVEKDIAEMEKTLTNTYSAK